MDRCTENSRTPAITCLSDENHDCDIKDYMLHYLGCLEICERKDFFKDINPLWEEEINHQKNLCNDHDEAKKTVAAKRASWEENCKSELRRIAFLRKTLAQDHNDKHLVEQLTKSAGLWRTSECYTKNIKQVQDWRKAKGKGDSPFPDVVTKETGDYEPEKDVNVPIIQFKDRMGVDIVDERVWNKFPNQKTTLSKLLYDNNDSFLRQPDSPQLLRYFHIPSNNMIWAERAIGKYFGDEAPDYHATHRELIRKKKTKTYMILREPYWRGQLHGGQQQSPPHERHLRPLCTLISSGNTEKGDHFPNNMVLFMPYLHWDTSRKREQFAVEIENIMNSAKAAVTERDQRQRKERQDYREQLPKKLVKSPEIDKENTRFSMPAFFKHKLSSRREETPQANDNPETSQQPSGNFGPISRILTFTSILKEFNIPKSRTDVDEKGRVKVNNSLGQYLLDAARLYEGMSNYRDKKLLRKYLSADPPLHPRRTLDQAYYWTLNSTRNRDRDQVVYRSTTAKPEDFHKYSRMSKNDDAWEWKKHKEFGIQNPCNECKTNIQKLSRVIMVDQLWMWILDANTIITCFPKRYGANKQDASGVHKSIRMRIQDNASAIRTVFDLALIIIDECSNTFFDRTQTVDRQPQVIEAFSKAIGAIMYKQTAAFERLWRWTDKASDIYRSRGSPDTSELHVPLLDINPEGKLEREIKDIIEELDIMIHITKTHKRILTTFIANAENMLDPLGELGGDQKREMAARHYWAKAQSRKQETPKSASSNDANDRDLVQEQQAAQDENFKQKEDVPQDPGKKDVYEREDDFNWFKLNAEERLESLLTRIEELEELRCSADNTAESVKDLLELKQQQASVVQAWQAVKQSEESIRQGRSIMIFTIMTIVFLPLSFMSSVFGMNNIEITSSTWSINKEFVYMFSISAGVIFISLVLAFGGWIRSVLFLAWKYLWTLFFMKSRLYDLWLDLNMPSQSVYQKANEITDRLKEDARRARFAKRRREREAIDQKAEAKRKKEERDASHATTSTGALSSMFDLVRPKQTNGSVNGSSNGNGNVSAV